MATTATIRRVGTTTDIAVTNLNVASDTSLSFAVPSGAAAGDYHLTIKTTGGSITSTAVFTVTAPTPPPTPSEQVLLFGGKTSGVTQNATSGDVTFAGNDSAYADMFLRNTPGAYVTWQWTANAGDANISVAFAHTKALGATDFGPTFSGNFTANGYMRVGVASNGRDLILQSSPDNVTFTTVSTSQDYASYYANDQFPLCLRFNGQGAIKGLKGYNTTTRFAQVVFDGNSLTAATNSSTGTTQEGNVVVTSKGYPGQLKQLLLAENPDYNVNYTFCVSSQTTQQMASDAATQIDVYVNSKYTQNILCAWEITNDFTNAGTTKEQCFENFKNYCLARKAAGWEVIIGNVIQRTTNLNSRTVQEIADMQAYINARLAAEWQQFADALVDLNALNLQNTAGWDGTHPSDAGYLLVAQAFRAAILSL